MTIKYYKATENDILNHLFSLDFSAQMALNHIFGEQARERDMKITEHILDVARNGRLIYRCKPVKLINKQKQKDVPIIVINDEF